MRKFKQHLSKFKEELKGKRVLKQHQKVERTQKDTPGWC